MAELTESLAGRRILVVDDHEMVLVGLRQLLGRQPWVERCLTATRSDEAVRLVRRYEPHVAMVDLFVGTEPGIDICRLLRAESPSLKVVFMSGLGSVAVAVARYAGASGFFPKHWPGDAVVEAVRRVSIGQMIFPQASKAEPVHLLSKRERDVLEHLVHGLSNPEVAAALHLSRHTIKQHASGVYRKLGVRNRAEAASLARQLGLVS